MFVLRTVKQKETDLAFFAQTHDASLRNYINRRICRKEGKVELKEHVDLNSSAVSGQKATSNCA